MLFTPTPLHGAYIIELERRGDERGFFARAYCAKEFADKGLTAVWLQANVGFSQHAGTLRGLHYQVAPYEEAKLVRCTKGAIFDVMVDLRPDSDSYKQWFGTELTDTNDKMVYVPEGCAHGYLALTDHAEVFYPVSQFYAPEYEQGVRWNDPAFGIQWPETARRLISPKDQSWPDYLP